MTETEVQQEREDEKVTVPSKRRRGWVKVLLILGGLIAFGLGALIWNASVHRHRASTYGIADPSGAALRVENRTSDFAISRVTIADAEKLVVFQDVGIEIGVGAEALFEIAPGTYLVRVHYVETSIVAPGRPQGFLRESFMVLPGKAVILRLQGGRSSPEGSIFIPPVLVIK